MTASASVRLNNVVKRFGQTTVLHDTTLQIRPGEFFSLLGPSGSGKTTTLRIIAGLEWVDGGMVEIDGKDVTFASASDRDVAMVFQSYALYPHMTVGENISFPLRMIGMRRAEIIEQVRMAADRVRIGHLLHRRPGQLSGGQQQRCALARAIVRSPRLFLLDEPLSNLDARLRLETRAELKQLQRALNVTTVYVTHDQEEAMSLSDRMAIFMDGRIVQIGSPEEVFTAPASVAVAGFLGSPPMNLLPARLAGGKLLLAGTSFPTDVPLSDQELVVGVRPLDVSIGAEGLPAQVLLSELLGESTIVDLRLGEELMRARLPQIQRFQEGEAVRVSFNARKLHLFAKDGDRLDYVFTQDARPEPCPV